MEINFVNHHKKRKLIFNHILTVKRFSTIAFFESKNIGAICFIFVSDLEILNINRKYLHHFYPTDVITFDYTVNNFIAGDIFISLDTVERNARIYNVSFSNELNRVMIHGILHLIGYKDKFESEKKIMRKKENFYLRLFK